MDHQRLETPRRRFEYPNSSYSHSQHKQQLQQGGDGEIIACSPKISGAAVASTPLADAVLNIDQNGDCMEGGLPGIAIIPNDWWKTLLALICTASGMLVMAISLSYVHDYVPQRTPLPDITLKMLPRIDWAINACEALLLMNIGIALVICLAHRYRWVLLRRAFFMLAIVFVYRSVTIAVTVMPDPDSRRFCEPRSNRSHSFSEIADRVTRIAMGGGFSVSNTHSICGDSIFSGHTASLTLSYLTIKEYTPASASPLHWISLVSCLLSFLFLIVSHAHYTVDLVIGYWLASRLFLMLHALAACPPSMRPSSPLAGVWWFSAFQFFEGNTPAKLPCEFRLPGPYSCCQRAYKRLDSFRMRLRGFMN